MSNQITFKPGDLMIGNTEPTLRYDINPAICICSKVTYIKLPAYDEYGNELLEPKIILDFNPIDIIAGEAYKVWPCKFMMYDEFVYTYNYISQCIHQYDYLNAISHTILYGHETIDSWRVQFINDVIRKVRMVLLQNNTPPYIKYNTQLKSIANFVEFDIVDPNTLMLPKAIPNP